LESIGNFAKKLSFGERKLFKWLREQKILMADNSPYQRHIDEGHFKVLDKTTDKNGKTISYSQTVLTGKGKTYVQKRLAKAGNPDLSE
jgi:anti-repressor protein